MGADVPYDRRLDGPPDPIPVCSEQWERTCPRCEHSELSWHDCDEDQDMDETPRDDWEITCEKCGHEGTGAEFQLGATGETDDGR